MIRACHRLAVLAALIALTVPTLAEAQGVGVGLKGGYLYSSFDLEGVSDVIDNSNGWMAGIFFGGNRPGTVGVMGEVNLLAKSGESEDGMDTATIYYLQVPLLLRINGGSRSRSGVSVYGIAGPAVDLKIGEDLGNISDTDEFESVDIGLVLGAGVELARFIIEGRYEKGLRNIYSDADGVEVKTQTFAILVGVRFN